jgi:hypothetical protein
MALYPRRLNSSGPPLKPSTLEPFEKTLRIFGSNKDIVEGEWKKRNRIFQSILILALKSQSGKDEVNM